MEGRAKFLARLVRIGAGVEQRLERLGVPMLRRRHERSDALLSRKVYVGTSIGEGGGDRAALGQ